MDEFITALMTLLIGVAISIGTIAAGVAIGIHLSTLWAASSPAAEQWVRDPSTGRISPAPGTKDSYPGDPNSWDSVPQYTPNQEWMIDPATGQPTRVQAPKTEAERDALPPGTFYRASDGSLHVRGANNSDPPAIR